VERDDINVSAAPGGPQARRADDLDLSQRRLSHFMFELRIPWQGGTP
jgi:hypothetical protein